MRRATLLLPLLMAATACSGAAATAHKAAPTTPASAITSLHGAVPGQEQPRPNFDLIDTADHPYDFATQTRGKVTLLYFGYTHCPDECPTAMADVAQALREVSPDVATKVDVVFATTDPWRDTGPVLRTWLDKFSPTFVGLTGTPTQIAGAEVRMDMPISKREAAPKSYGSGAYAVEHFAAVLVYGRDNQLVTLYPSGVTPEDIAADLKVLVKG